jgi:lipoyl(octanoyl) transferase
MPELWVVRFPVLPYEWGVRFQQMFATARQEGRIPDLLLLLEHTPVYTRGRRTRPEELPMGEDWYRAQGIEICGTDRGGAVTYHGPGQLVGYPIVSLKPYGDDVREYVRKLERTVIEALGAYDIEAQTIKGLTGVWTAGLAPGLGESGQEASKIGSIGIHISRGVTTHGLAVNVNNDLQPFEWIVPCGIEGARMTSVSRELGAQQDLDGFAEGLAHHYASIFERQRREIDFTDAISEARPIGETELSNAFAALT